jgi:hypothetical protein
MRIRERKKNEFLESFLYVDDDGDAGFARAHAHVWYFYPRIVAFAVS